MWVTNKSEFVKSFNGTQVTLVWIGKGSGIPVHIGKLSFELQVENNSTSWEERVWQWTTTRGEFYSRWAVSQAEPPYINHHEALFLPGVTKFFIQYDSTKGVHCAKVNKAEMSQYIETHPSISMDLGTSKYVRCRQKKGQKDNSETSDHASSGHDVFISSTSAVEKGDGPFSEKLSQNDITVITTKEEKQKGVIRVFSTHHSPLWWGGGEHVFSDI